MVPKMYAKVAHEQFLSTDIANIAFLYVAIFVITDHSNFLGFPKGYSVLNLKYAGELSINNWTGLLVFYLCSRKNKVKKNIETDRQN